MCVNSEIKPWEQEQEDQDSEVPTWDPVERRTHGVTGTDSVSVLDDFF